MCTGGPVRRLLENRKDRRVQLPLALAPMEKTAPRSQIYWSAVLLSGILLLYFPALIYRDNADFLDASFAAVLVMLLPTFLMLALLLSTPAAFAGAKTIE